MKKSILSITAVLGGLGVIIGAMAAHALKSKLSEHDLTNVHTAVLYQMIHVLAILGISAMGGIVSQIKNRIAGLFLTGILFFSGSIYLISIFGVDAHKIWFITPLGGLLFILAWFYTAWAVYKENNQG